MYGVVGISASAIASRKLRQQMLDGSIQITAGRLRSFTSTCLAHDRHATFALGERWVVTPSLCNKGVTMKEAYHTTRFTAHVKKCTKRALMKAKVAAENAGRRPAHRHAG